MRLDINKMSKEELQFIRLYCVLLRRHYCSVKAVMALMTPENFGVRDPLVAARLAYQLAGVTDDFDARLDEISKKHGIKTKLRKFDEAQLLNELADLFALSFFKVIAVQEDDQPEVTLIKDGWCSGSPTDWGVQIDLGADAKEEWQQTIISKIANFFSAMLAGKKLPPKKKYPKPDYKHDEEDYPDDGDWDDAY